MLFQDHIIIWGYTGLHKEREKELHDTRVSKKKILLNINNTENYGFSEVKLNTKGMVGTRS